MIQTTLMRTRNKARFESLAAPVLAFIFAIAYIFMLKIAVFPCGGLAIKDGESSKRHISGTTWDVYLYILTSKEPVGVRNVWRNLKLSSPSLAQYHINKLLSMKLLSQTHDGKCWVQEKEKVEALRSFVLLRGRLIPRLVFYGALIAGILAIYLIFRPPRWDFRDLLILAISALSIFAFFFEAYSQYRSMKVAVQTF